MQGTCGWLYSSVHRHFLTLQSFSITSQIFDDKAMRYQGLETAELLVGVVDKF